MSKGVILIDYDNALYRADINPDHVKSQLRSIIEHVLNNTIAISRCEVRLYGGWRSCSSFTKKANQLQSLLEEMNSSIFPAIRDGIIMYGEITLVTSLYGIDYVWDNTFQEKSGIHRLKVKNISENICNQDKNKCPIHLIASATRNKDVACPIDGCEYVDFSQLVRMEQKMVDTMISCDILEFTKDEDYKYTAVVSDDIDMHPALVLAGAKYLKNDNKLFLFVKNHQRAIDYQLILNNYNISVEVWD